MCCFEFEKLIKLHLIGGIYLISKVFQRYKYDRKGLTPLKRSFLVRFVYSRSRVSRRSFIPSRFSRSRSDRRACKRIASGPAVFLSPEYAFRVVYGVTLRYAFLRFELNRKENHYEDYTHERRDISYTSIPDCYYYFFIFFCYLL